MEKRQLPEKVKIVMQKVLEYDGPAFAKATAGKFCCFIGQRFRAATKVAKFKTSSPVFRRRGLLSG